MHILVEGDAHPMQGREEKGGDRERGFKVSLSFNLEVLINIYLRFLNNKKLYFLNLGLIFVSTVLIQCLSNSKDMNFSLKCSHYFIGTPDYSQKQCEVWSLLGKRQLNSAQLIFPYYLS